MIKFKFVVFGALLFVLAACQSAPLNDRLISGNQDITVFTQSIDAELN